MAEHLKFAIHYEYDSRQVGVTVQIRLRTWAESIDLHAKIDTGTSLCLFERKHAERLGITVESGSLEKNSTVTGSFVVYGHEVTKAAPLFVITHGLASSRNGSSGVPLKLTNV